MEFMTGNLNGADDFLGLAGGAAIFLLLAVLILMALREFFCWYWKVNQMVSVLENIEQAHRQSLKRLQAIEKALETQIEQTETEDEPEPTLWPPMIGSPR